MTTANVPSTRATHGASSHYSLIEIIRSEFSEMPGLRLSRPQFRRLWSLTPDDCDRIVGDLIRAGFLVECQKGLIRRKVVSC